MAVQTNGTTEQKGQQISPKQINEILKLNSQLLTSTLIMIPDKSLSFVKSKNSDSLMNFPAFLYLGFRSNSNLIHGVDIWAVTMGMN